MTTLRRQTRSFWHSTSCNYLMIPLLSLLIAQCKPQIPYTILGSTSNNTFTYGDQFQSNLDNVLNVLVQNTPTTGLNVSSYGESPNRVYGLLQCRGDASQKECSDCCQNIRNNVSTFCRNSIECRLWLLMCELHYRNYSSSSFISNSSTETPFLGAVFHQFMKGEETAFRNLVYNLSIKASTSINRFATGPSVDSSGHKIYALVQCDRVLSTTNCSNCLSDASKQLDTYTSYSALYMDGCFVLQSNQSLSTNHSAKLPMNLGVGRAVLLLIALLLLLM